MNPSILWEFADKRQDLFYSKINPLSRTVTDEIFKTYKFTNVFRASDRVSQYLINHVIYNPAYSKQEEDVIFRILLFKIFNKTSTWKLFISHWQQDLTLDLFKDNFDNFCDFTTRLRDEGQTIFSNAYIMPSGFYGFKYKASNLFAWLRRMLIEDQGVKKLMLMKSMKEVVKFMQSYPLIGPFLAYQYAIDLNYSECFNFSESEYVLPGDGCIRGLAKIHGLTLLQAKSIAPSIIAAYYTNQHKHFDGLGLKFKNLFGRDLQWIDIQSLCCETDKYCRAAFPSQEGFGRKRIKEHYNPSKEKIIYQFPPKWKINDKAMEYMKETRYIVS